MTYTLKIRDGSTREFWVQQSGGYVYEVDGNHPGTLGRQVSYSLGYSGDMMTATPETLQSQVVRARRRERTIQSRW